jgi:hypothetical protein
MTKLEIVRRICTAKYIGKMFLQILKPLILKRNQLLYQQCKTEHFIADFDFEIFKQKTERTVCVDKSKRIQFL